MNEEIKRTTLSPLLGLWNIRNSRSENCIVFDINVSVSKRYIFCVLFHSFFTSDGNFFFVSKLKLWNIYFGVIYYNPLNNKYQKKERAPETKKKVKQRIHKNIIFYVYFHRKNI